MGKEKEEQKQEHDWSSLLCYGTRSANTALPFELAETTTHDHDA